MKKAKKKVGIAALSFVADRDGKTLPKPIKDQNPRCFWNVAATGKYAEDCKIGERLALEYLALEEADKGGGGHLHLIVGDMPRPLTGIETSFLMMVSMAAGAGAAEARRVAKYWQAQHAMVAPEALPCPVVPIAIRLGQAWDAFSMAEECNREDAAKCIEKLRMFLEEAASFERAQSMAGALIQMALVGDAATALHEKVTGENKAADLILERLDRLLDSAALVLYDACSPEEYAVIRNTMNVYKSLDGDSVDQPLKWLEDVPALAKAYRSKDAA